MKGNILILLTSAFFNVCAAQIQPCKRSDPEFSGCIKNFIESLGPSLKYGHVALGLKIERECDPLFLGDLLLDAEFGINLFGLRVFGLSTFIINNVRSNFKKIKFGITLTIPSFRTSSTYSLHMTQGSQIKASGDASSQSDNVTVTMRFLASEYQRKGKTYIKIDDVKVKLTPGKRKIQVNFEKLMPHAMLNESSNETINQSFPLFIPQYKTQVEEKCARDVFKMLNEILKVVTSDELLPC